MSWGTTSATSDYMYISMSSTDTASTSSSWVMSTPTFKAPTIEAPEYDLTIEGDIFAPKFEERMLKQIEELVEDRLSKLIPLYIDAIRWGRPEENSVGSRCFICGAPREPETGCDYCGN